MRGHHSTVEQVASCFVLHYLERLLCHDDVLGKEFAVVVQWMIENDSGMYKIVVGYRRTCHKYNLLKASESNVRVSLER